MKSSRTCDSRSRFSSSNAFLPRFSRGERISGFAVKAIDPLSVLQIAKIGIASAGLSAIIPVYGGYSSVAERRSVAADVVGSKPTSRPKISDQFNVLRSNFASRISSSTSVLCESRISRFARIFAGTSGWAYPTWKPDFYPAGTPAKRFLEFYSSQLTSVEVNYTFRALPTAKMLEGWLAATRQYFRFSFKAPQRMTHFKRLATAQTTSPSSSPRSNPSARPANLALLFQLPPNFKADASASPDFLATLRYSLRRDAHRVRVPPRVVVHGGDLLNSACSTTLRFVSLRAMSLQHPKSIPPPATPVSSSPHRSLLARGDRRLRPALYPLAESATSISTSSTRTSPAERSTPSLFWPMLPKQAG